MPIRMPNRNAAATQPSACLSVARAAPASAPRPSGRRDALLVLPPRRFVALDAPDHPVALDGALALDDPLGDVVGDAVGDLVEVRRFR